MGSSCCKQSEIISTYQESELIDFFDMRIDQEIYPLKVHKGFRNLLKKNKLVYSIDEGSSLNLLQNDSNKNTSHHNCDQTIFYSEYEQKQENLQIKIQELKSIIKPRTSHHSIKSSTRHNTQLKTEQNQFKRRQRIRSEKKVRFKIPKQHKNSSNSSSRSKYRCRQTQIGLY